MEFVSYTKNTDRKIERIQNGCDNENTLYAFQPLNILTIDSNNK